MLTSSIERCIYLKCSFKRNYELVLKCLFLLLLKAAWALDPAAQRPRWQEGWAPPGWVQAGEPFSQVHPTSSRLPRWPRSPYYLFILSVSSTPFSRSNRICFTFATLPTVAALWIFPRSLSWMWYPYGEVSRLLLLRQSPTRLLPGPLDKPKGDTPFLPPKPKIFFIADSLRASEKPHFPLKLSTASRAHYR